MDKTFQRRSLFVAFGFTTLFSLLSARLIYVQCVKHDYYAGLVERTHVHKVVLPGRRGHIFDRRGGLLAGNEARFTIVADKMHLDDLQVCASGLRVAEGIAPRDLARIYSEEEIRERYFQYLTRVVAAELEMDEMEFANSVLKSSRMEVVLKKNVSEDAALHLREIMAEAGVRGIYTRDQARRFYPSPHRLTHVLGFTDHKGSGKAGIEGALDSVLRGGDGFRYVERDRKGREIAAYRGEVLEPTDGKDVTLTIDMRIQEVVESVLDEVGDVPGEIYVPELRAEKVSVIIMRPETGEIVAMANRPDFDLVTRVGNYRNFAVSDTYEPGSTFKIVALGGVFDQGLAAPETVVWCNNGRLDETGIKLVDSHPYGDLSVNQVMAKSSNIGAYKLARQLGRKRFYDYMKKFGFGSRTGVRLADEGRGLVHPVARWSTPSLSRMAMGYEVSLTPLQMLCALGAVANGGELLAPKILKSIGGKGGEAGGRTVVRRVLSERAADRLRRAMIDVVAKGGTGTAAAVEGYLGAGKTGTAQKYDQESRRYLKGRYIVSYMGFLPAENPQLMGIVVVDDPQLAKSKRFGGTVAAPVFRRIMERAMPLLDIEPELYGRVSSS